MASRVKLAGQVGAVALVAALLGLLVWKVAHQNGGAASKVDRGKTVAAPGFALNRLDAPGRLALRQLRGRAVVLNFWASWCVPCKQEVGKLEAASRRWKPRGAVIVGVDVNDFKGDARHFLRAYGVTYPTVHDGHGTTVGPYGLTGFPETFFVNRRGQLVGQHIDGPVTDEQLAQNIRRALES
jgi:cytochrome c biogenesis protein CcmG/thiol:disulfide interchange protein DsbE